MEKTALQFPEEFLKRWLKNSNPNLSEADIENEFPRFLEGIKWNLIKTHLLKEADVQISKEDLLEQTALMIKAEYGLGGDDEQSQMLVKQLAEKMLEDKEHVNRVYEILEESKVFDVLKDKFEIKEKEVSLEKFKDLNKKKK
jgi:trigger factor